MESSTLYNVIFRGEIAENQQLEEVKRKLASMFKLKASQIEEMFAGNPLTVKARVDHQTALKYQNAFKQAGAICHIEPFKQANARQSQHIIKAQTSQTARKPVSSRPSSRAGKPPQTKRSQSRAGVSRTSSQEKPSSGASLKPIIMTVVFLIIFGITGSVIRNVWFSKPKEEPVPIVPDNSSQATDGTTSPQTKAGSNATTTPDVIKDEGKPCQHHTYVLPAGANEFLAFSKQYSLEDQEILAYNYASHDQLNTVSSYGISVGLPVVRYEETSVMSSPVWVVDGQMVFRAVRSDPSYDQSKEWGEGGGVPYSIPLRHSVHGDFGTLEIQWRPDGYAVITNVPGVNGKEAVGKLSREELIEKLNPGGFQPSITYVVTDLGQTFELLATQIQEEKQIKIQFFDVPITVPASIDPNVKSMEVAFTSPDAKNKLAIRVGARGGDPNKMNFTITGPAELPECFQ